jgi:hypothetical protein
VSVEILTAIICLAAGFDTSDYSIVGLGPFINICILWREVIIGFANFWRNVNVVVFSLSSKLSTQEVPYLKSFLGILAEARNIEIVPQEDSGKRYRGIIAPLPFLYSIIPHVRQLSMEGEQLCFDDTILRFLKPSGELMDMWLTNSCLHNHQACATPA